MATYHHHSPAEAAAAALDAADGVRDGRFYGNPIILERAPANGGIPVGVSHPYGPSARVVSQRTYLEPAPRVEPFGATTYVNEGPPAPALAPRVVHTRFHDLHSAPSYVAEQQPVRIGRSFAYEPTRVVRDFHPGPPTYVRGATPVEYLDLADSSPRVFRQPPLRRVVRGAYEDAPLVVEGGSPHASVVYDHSGPPPPVYTEAPSPTHSHHSHHRHNHRHRPHSPTHSIVVDGGRHPYEYDAPIVVSPDTYDPRVHPLERGEMPVDARPVDVLFKKSKKLIDVPITRKVKVPTVEERIVPTTKKQRVPTTKLIQEQTFKWVDEPYTDFEEREVTQMKEIWVKKLVPEKVVQKVPVKRSRKVKVPTTVTREVETVEEVEVPTTALVKVPAFRVDEIYETAQAEVETVQKIELVPRVVEEWDEEGRLIEGPHRKVERIVGQVTYDPREPMLSEVDSESSTDSLLPSTPGHVALAPSSHRHSHRRRHHSHHETPSTPGRQVRRRIGFTLQSSSSGLIVRNVEPGSPAEFARVEVGDVVRAVNGVPVSTNGEFQSAVQRADAVTLEYWSHRLGRSFSKRINLIE